MRGFKGLCGPATSVALTAALAAAPTWKPAPGAQESDELRFEPGPGPLQRDLTLEIGLELVDVGGEVRGADGKVRTPAFAEQHLGAEISVRAELVSTDRYESGSRAGELQLVRRYAELSLEGERDPALDGTSGWHREASFARERTVAFAWNPETGEARASLVGEPSPPSLRPLLDSLHADLDFGWALADGPLLEELSDPPATWELDPTRFLRGIWPGGFTEVAPTYDPNLLAGLFMLSEGLPLPAEPSLWWLNIDGTVRASILPAGAGDPDTTAIRLVLALGGDPCAALNELLEEQHEASTGLRLAVGGIDWSFAGEGRLRWSRSRCRMKSLSIEGEITVRRMFEWDSEWEYFGSGEIHSTWRGPVRFSATLEELPPGADDEAPAKPVHANGGVR